MSKIISCVPRIILILLVTVLITACIACQRYDNVTYEVTGDADSVDVVVTNDNSGTIRLSIYVNGKLFKTATSSGPYVNAVVTGNK